MSAAGGLPGALGRGATPALLLAAVAAAGGLALAGDGYAVRLATLAGVQALLVLGYQLVFGHAGALSLAQGALFGLGAYAAALASLHAPWAAAISLPLAALAAMAVAALVGAVVLRLETHYFALATLAVAQLVHLALVNLETLTGGANGIAGVPPAAPFGLGVARGWPTLLLVWCLFAVAGVAVTRAFAGLRGAVSDLARELPLAAQSIGVDVAALRFTAFVAGAGLAGLAGALHAHVVGVVSPDVADMPVMVACLIATVIGGRRSVAGAALGAILLTHAPEWFRFLENRHLIAFGLLALLVVIAMPEGLAGALDAVAARLRGAPMRSATPRSAIVPSRAAPTGGAALRLEAVVKDFGGVRALDGVSFAVPARAAVGLIGPNGSGKTTVVNVVTGLVVPDSGGVQLGAIRLDGRAPFAIARAGVARTFQHAELPADASALDAVASAAAAGTPRPADSDARTAARAALVRIGFGDGVDIPCGALPAGRRRLVEIARALATRPALLILDEPGAGLSPAERADLAARLRAVNATGVALLIVDHDVAFLAACVERLVCLDRGRVVADGPVAAVRRDPAVRAAYFGDAAPEAAA
ncbi:MAG: ATP-binding cassette domain-containing protein [Rhodospirillales bacterium]|nr:MAG: ATP-binding cassette domain-containing protein [Rhodospirillales bacterium]